MEDLKQIKKEQEELVRLFELNNSFLAPEVQSKSQQLDKLIVEFLKKKGEVKSITHHLPNG